MKKSLEIMLLLVVFTLLLNACSNSEDENNTSKITPNTYVVGSVTKLGSVYVNGMRYDTSSASITRDGAAATANDVLQMPVEVVASTNGSSGIATAVVAETVVKGVLDSVPSNEVSLQVMGQTIRLDDGAMINTIAGNNVLADLDTVGMLVEVAGFVKEDGIIVATRVEEKSALTEYKVTGYISALGAGTFDISGKTIDYSGADTSDLGGAPAVGMLVEAKASANGDPLMASVVEKDGPSVSDAANSEVEGYIRSIAGTSPDFTFTVDGQSVATNTNTVFETGSNSFLANGVKVEVEGVLSSGVLTAAKVSLKDSVRAEGDLINVSGNDFSLNGLTGITFTIDSSTEQNISTDAKESFVNGDHVRLRGTPTGTNTVKVSRIDERNADTGVYLRGPAQSKTASSVTILGVAVTTTGLASFEDQNGSAVFDEASFLALVSAGTPVKLSGNLVAGPAVNWDGSGELED
ncbi:MAG: DUF5666 domain-containing protein [Gammaproteobacteria bacterium]|nr:DUF5666 domain-containing protein [Gammaproteobacteria bacterium]MDH5692213.1 DUF5666 domain-containing protein [Gammaproteobacteria bacterium]